MAGEWLLAEPCLELVLRDASARETWDITIYMIQHTITIRDEELNFQLAMGN